MEEPHAGNSSVEDLDNPGDNVEQTQAQSQDTQQQPEAVKQSESAPAKLVEVEDEEEEHSLFMWASPVLPKKYTSSPHMYPAVSVSQDQSSPINMGEHFSRDMFLQTGRFDHDIDMLLQEANQGAAHSPGEVERENESLVSEDEEALKIQLAQQLPKENGNLAEDSYIDNQSMNQGNFSLGELSLSADSYIIEESTNQSNMSHTESMDQSIRSAIAGLNGRPSDEGIQPSRQPTSIKEMQFQGDSNTQISQNQQAVGNLNDSFSSEVTEPEEQVEREPPMALLMYSQPKVWTDDAGEPTKLEEGEEEEEEEIGEEQLEKTLDDKEAAVNQPSTAGLWMQDDMLQTIVPFRKTPSNPSSEAHGTSTPSSPVKSTPSHTQSEHRPVSQMSNESIANVSSSSRASVQSSSSSGSQIKASQRTSSNQALPSRHQIKKDVKNSSNSSLNEDQQEKVKKTQSHGSQSKIPQTIKSAQHTKNIALQNTSSESLKSTSSRSVNVSQSKSGSATQFTNMSHKKQQKQTPSNTSVNGTKKVKANNKDVKSSSSKSLDKSSSSITNKDEIFKSGSEPSYNLSQRSSSSLSSMGENRVSRSSSSSQGRVTQKRSKTDVSPGTDESPGDKLNVFGAVSEQLSPQEVMLQELHRSRIALQHQGQLQGQINGQNQGQIQGNLHYQLKGHEISSLNTQSGISYQGQQFTDRVSTQHAQLPSSQDYMFQNTQGQQSQNYQAKTAQGQYAALLQGHPLDSQVPPGQGLNSQLKSSSLQQGQTKPATQTLDELLADVGTDVFSMEQVRGHLHTMLKQTTHAIPEKSYDSGQMPSLLHSEDRDEESFMSNSTFPMATSKSLADLTAQMESLGGYGAVTAVPVSAPTPAPRGEATLIMENQLVKGTLEKEMFRRKHCEKQIHLLQSKLLEVQQQLAVAVNTDRKKDTMIEQLDKALAKVVEGWRKREAEKVEIIQRLQTENKQFVERSEAQQELLHKFEAETAIVVDQLTAAQKSVELAQRDRDHKVAVADRERLEMLETLEETQDRLQAANMERERHHQKVTTLNEQLCDTRATLEADREAWEEKEREFLQKIDEITDNHIRVIEQGKLTSEQQTELLRETHDLLTAAQSEVHELRMKLDTTIRERESLNVQIGILESKMENSLRKQEADLRSEAERQLSEKLSEVQQRHRAMEEERSERHRHQVSELSQRHTEELKDLTRQHQDALRRKDEALTEKALEFEEKLSEGRNEIEALQGHVQKLEGQRLEVTSRLQARMQAHFTEALGILMNGDTAATTDLTNVMKKQLDGIYTMGLTPPSTDPTQPDRSQSTACQKDHEEKQDFHTDQPISFGHQSQGREPVSAGPQLGFTTTSSDVTSDRFSALQPDVSSPPEPLISTAPTEQGPILEHPQFATRHQTYPSDRHPSRIPPVSQQQFGNRDTNTSLPFQTYGLPGHLGVKQGFHGNQSFQDSHQEREEHYGSHKFSQNQSFQGNQSYHSNQSYHGNQNYHGNQVHPQQSNVPPSVTETTQQGFHGSQDYHDNKGYHSGQSFHGNQSYHGSQGHPQQTNVPQNALATNTVTMQNNRVLSTNAQSHSEELQPSRPVPASRPVVARLEPSFLETLASEAERLGGYHASQNSSMMSEFEGLAPLPPDTSMSTIHDDGPHHNMTALSSGPLMDTTRFSESYHHAAAQGQPQPNGMDYSVMSERFKQHDERQQELQKYIKMLLNRSDEDSQGADGRVEGTPPSQDTSLLTPTKNQPSPVQFRGQGHPPGRAFAKTTVPASGLPKPDFDTNQEEDEQPVGLLSPGQAGEISRLLGIYRSRASVDPVGSGPDEKTEVSVSNRTNTQNRAPGAQGTEILSREQPRKDAQQVIKVPTGAEPIPKSSPTRTKPAAKAQTRAPTGARQQPPSKPERKSAGGPGDKKEKPKSATKVWK